MAGDTAYNIQSSPLKLILALVVKSYAKAVSKFFFFQLI